MFKKVSIGSSDFTILGQDFPLYLAPVMSTLCENLLQVREQILYCHNVQSEWEAWSKEHSWPDDKPLDDMQQVLRELQSQSWSQLNPLREDVDVLIQKIQNGVQYHHRYEQVTKRLCALEEQRDSLDQNFLRQSLDPRLFSNEDLQHLIDHLNEIEILEPNQLYRIQLDSNDPYIYEQANLLLNLEKELHDVGISLYWPSPPFGDDFEHRLFEQIKFQLCWTLQICILQNQLTKEERVQLSFPTSPLSGKDLIGFLSTHKDIIQERSFWAINTLYVSESEAITSQINSIEHWINVKVDEFKDNLKKRQRELKNQHVISKEVSDRISTLSYDEKQPRLDFSELVASKSTCWQFMLTSQFGRMPSRLDASIIRAFRVVDRSWFVSSKVDGLLELSTESEVKASWKQLQKRSSLNGKWTGSYVQNNKKHSFHQTIRFVSGSISGDGVDHIASFDIEGSYVLETGRVYWKKNYHGRHSIDYEGICDGVQITGTWKLKSLQDSFEMKPEFSLPKCYKARPVFMGYGVNNSAPYMHMIGLFYIQDILKKSGLRILDVGCGTGFVTAILAAAVKDPAIIIGIDHVSYFIEQGKNIISWMLPELAPRIHLVEGDARYGTGEHVFDVIHLGAAPTSMQELEPLLRNLSLGGKLIGPVTVANKQRFVCITRTEDGFSTQDLFGVRYTTLQKLEHQIS